MSKDTQLEEFNAWLSIMEMRLDEFSASLPLEVASKLNFSIESLEILEEWMLKSFDSIDQIMEEENKLLLDGISRYIGECMRMIHGFKWELCLDNPKNVYYELPILASPDGISQNCPLTLATASIDRRRGDFIMNVVTYMND